MATITCGVCANFGPKSACPVCSRIMEQAEAARECEHYGCREAWAKRTPKTQLGEWQKCPVCEGRGVVQTYNIYGTSIMHSGCRRCNGSGTIERPAATPSQEGGE